MLRFFVRAGWALVVAAFLTALAVLFLDYNIFKPRLEAIASQAMEEEARIQGNVRPGFLGWRPALVLQDVVIAKVIKADWLSVTSDRMDLSRRLILHAHNLSIDGTKAGNYDIPLDTLSDGFIIDPLYGELNGAELTGSVKYQDKRLSVDTTLTGFPLDTLLKEAEGKIDGTFKLEATGDTQDKIMHSLTGRIMLTSGAGKISSASLNLMSRGLIKALLPGGKTETKLNCAVFDFDVKNGVATSRAIIVDTDEISLFGRGTINLINSRMDIRLQPRPKDLTLVSLATPVRVTGTLKAPQALPETKAMVKKIGGMLLGAVNPAFALVQLLDTGSTGYNAACVKLLQEGHKP